MCACVCVHGLVQRLGVDSNILLRMVNCRCRLVSRYFLSGSIASVPMANERICDLVLQRIAVRLVVCVCVCVCVCVRVHGCVFVCAKEALSFDFRYDVTIG